MDVRGTGVKRCVSRPGTTLFGSAVLLAVVLFSCSPASALPAFARKYGMPCSACHEAWPMLSPFGQQFKDNGYQMGNDRDAPIFQNPGYSLVVMPYFVVHTALRMTAIITGKPIAASFAG